MASSKRRRKRRPDSSLRRELNDLVRGLCGGFLFGIPLLYTMEVWWIGSSVSPPQLSGVLLTTLVGTYLLSRTGGFRKSQATTEREAMEDAIEAIALGILCALTMLVILRQITFETRLSETIGQIVFESVPFALGVALANQFLQNADDSDDSEASAPTPASQSESSQSKLSKIDRLFPEDNLNETISDIGATLLGALIVAFSIAPTDEVTVLVAAINGPWLMLILFVSLVLSYSIVFQANFTRQEQRRLQSGLFQKPISETVFSYLLSLTAAALMLGFFGKIDTSASVDLAFKQILILGLPATIGGAAGRLAV